METDKFEKHIKTKLQEREIQPSANAWSKIASELNDDDAKKKPVYLWMGIAASVVVLIGIAMFYFNGNTAVTKIPTEIVDIEKDRTLNEVSEKDVLPIGKEEVEVVAHSETETSIEKVVEEENILIKEQEPLVLKDEIEVAVNQVPTSTSVEKLVVTDDIINSKVADVIAQVTVLEQNSTVTDAEVDSLLKRAQDEILRDKIFNKDKSVDAMALLTEVEDELDQSFRDQIFDSLKAGFIKVRTAVADRNN
ncbi:MAG: hypothetical protein ABJO28_17850 [Maribacter dokdonensis]|uniref:hypothetical protein n=1 Tax=Maribacter dokdonensis TaxID=320912 RepID=UPI0032651B95